MSCLNDSKGFAPETKRPLTKNPGVPVTPRRAASAASASTFFLTAGEAEVLAEAIHVEPELLRVLLVLLRAHLALVREDEIVHLPELALAMGSLRGSVGGRRLRVHAPAAGA